MPCLMILFFPFVLMWGVFRGPYQMMLWRQEEAELEQRRQQRRLERAKHNQSILNGNEDDEPCQCQECQKYRIEVAAWEAKYGPVAEWEAKHKGNM